MNFDLSQFLQQFEDLEADNIAQWPIAVKVVVAMFAAALVAGLSYSLLVSDKISLLENVTQEEVTLKEEYRGKYHVAANLELFKKQMKEAKKTSKNASKKLSKKTSKKRKNASSTTEKKGKKKRKKIVSGILDISNMPAISAAPIPEAFLLEHYVPGTTV